jgi:TRAP-type uncharacterized transport system fused permease subunit
VIRSLHVGFLLCITFILYPAFKSGGRLSKVGVGDTVLAFGALALSTYHWIFEAELIQRSGDPSSADLFVGTALVILTFEATRRILGLALPIVCGICSCSMACSASTCRANSRIAATASTRS